jgi:hypothetical protein
LSDSIPEPVDSSTVVIYWTISPFSVSSESAAASFGIDEQAACKRLSLRSSKDCQTVQEESLQNYLANYSSEFTGIADACRSSSVFIRAEANTPDPGRVVSGSGMRHTASHI